MFYRNISTDEVGHTLQNGVPIMEYPDDKPYPSKLLFATYNLRPLHVICSYNEQDNIIIVITAYEPSLSIWENDYKTKKTK